MFRLNDLNCEERGETFRTLAEANRERDRWVKADGLAAYEILEGEMTYDDGCEEFSAIRRVELCEPYMGDDDRVAQGIGQ